jgi:DNA polymerase-3 subunit alpha
LRPIAERIKDHKGRGVISLCLPAQGGRQEVEVELPGRFSVTPQLRRSVKDVRGVLEVEEL